MNDIPAAIVQNELGLGPWCILSGYRGSIAHGMYVPKSAPDSIDDKDIMAICVPPQEYYLGLKMYGRRGTREILQGEWDIVIYEIKKMIAMLMEGNPNVLSMLWLASEHYLVITDAGRLLLQARQHFIGRHVYESFAGYASSQLHRMTHLAFKGFMGEKRKRLVEQHGYDTKNAAHLIRLLRMGIEFLNDGTLQVVRKDAQQLLDIKMGKWPLQRVTTEAQRLFKELEQAHAHSKLPNGPNEEKINKLCVKIIQTAWKNGAGKF